MNIRPFKLERYFAEHEFSVPYLFCCSDCEPIGLGELLSMADNKTLPLWNKLKLGYTESQGHPLLIEEIAKFYIGIKPEHVLVIAPEEGIFISMNVLLKKGDHLIVTYPSYQSLYEVAHSLGCTISKWMPDEKRGWDFNIEFLKSEIKTNTRLIVINFPHNPTGSLITKKGLLEILEIARKNNIVVFSDEMYRLLEFDQSERLNSVCEIYENSVTLSGLSKVFALAGLRIGWIITKNKEIFDKISAFKDYTTICSSAPSEILALIALRSNKTIIDRNIGIINKNLKLLDKFFKKYSQIFFWNRPKAGTVGFPKLLLKKDVSEFCQELIEKKGVLLLPSNVYDFPVNNFRVGFGRKKMPEALSKLEEFLIH